MTDKLLGLICATIAVVVGASMYHLGRVHGAEEESKRMATELTRRRLAYWRIDNGTAHLEYRYVPRVHDTCVKYGGTP